MKNFYLLAIVIAVFGGACKSPKYINKGTKVWVDNFSSKKLDTTKWAKIPRGGADWNRHMSNADSCYLIKNGKLILLGLANHNKTVDTAGVLTGGIYTKDKMSFDFGRVEIRAKFVGAQGAWPAFWFLAQGQDWPKGGEIDLVERLNNDAFVYQTIHTHYTLDLKIKNNPKSSITAKINPKAFNTYALEKYPDSLVFYVNNKRTFAYPRIDTKLQWQYPFSENEHYLLLDMQLGGNWVGKIDKSQLPSKVLIDKVSYYKF